MNLEDQKSLQLINVLDGNIRQIELTSTQQEQLETAYRSVGQWLADSDHPLLRNVQIYPQGSVRLRTTVRPLGKDEFDVDLICFLPDANPLSHSAEYIYQLVGQRLKEHGTYRQMLAPKNRCWRLDYSDGSRFHMDITPAMPNTRCRNNGILVPDRDHKALKPSNPVGYAELFDGISQLAPQFLSLEMAALSAALAGASIEPLPDPMQPKDFLRRIVQLSKRHRDIYFKERNGYPPISIVLTTLAMESYAASTKHVFQNPWEFVRAVIAGMPDFISKTDQGYEVLNPSTEGENFAEKWNEDSDRASDFYFWHRMFLADIDELMAVQGLDQVSSIIGSKLIGPESTHWQQQMINGVNRRRNDGGLSRTSKTGGISAAIGAPVLKNTFYGDAC